MTLPDKRLNAFRPDLADASLRGQVEAAYFTEGRPAQVTTARMTLRRGPAESDPQDSELLRGETVTLFEIDSGWAWVQAERDRYVGYCPMDGLTIEPVTADYLVNVPHSFVFPEPDIKTKPLQTLPMMASSGVTGKTDGRFSELEDGGWIITAHLSKPGELSGDPVAVAREFMGVPYLWGGRTAAGIDCSGLVQTALARCGINAPRDSDMQEAELGDPVDFNGDFSVLQHGDLIFWKGHVGWICENGDCLHANATDMRVTASPADAVAARIREAEGNDVTSVRRISI